jgi:hypothetical protein
MVTLARTALGIVWGLWFGGVIALFIFAVTLFNGLGRETAAIATGVMFPAFERYHLVLAALALAACVAWRGLSRSRAATFTFFLLAVATVMAVVSASVITPRILELRHLGQTHTPEFGRAHGISGVLYVVEAVSLLGAGLTLLAAGNRRREPITPDAPAAPTTSSP